MAEADKNKVTVVCSPEDELILRLFMGLSEKNKLRSEGYMSCLSMMEEKQDQKPA